MKRLILSTLVLLALSSCVMPAPTTDLPAPLSPEATKTKESTEVPAPEEPTLNPTIPPEPAGMPIAHFAPGAPVVITYVQMVDPFQGWALGISASETEHILHTANAGEKWVDVTPPTAAPEDGAPIRFLPFFLDKTTAWAIVNVDSGSLPAPATGVWRTTDGGVTWSRSAGLRSADLMVEGWYPSFLNFIDARRGWLMVGVGAGAGHAYVVLFRTADGGATWERFLDPYTLESAAVHTCCQSGLFFVDPDVGMIPLADSNYMRIVVNWTADGGSTWTSSFPPAPPGAADLFDRSTCAVSSTAVLSPEDIRLGVRCRVFDGGADQHYIYTTTDQGETWTISSFPGGALLFLDATHGLALARDLFATDDGGASWARIKTVSWDGQFSFVNKDQGWAVARSGDEIALVRTSDGGRTWEELETVISP